MKANTRIDPMKGVVKPDNLINAIRRRDVSYIRGALQFLERKPPNPYVVTFLEKALERIRSEHRD